MPKNFGSLDAAETPQQEAEGVLRMGQQITRLKALQRRRADAGSIIESGSSLSGDDTLNPFHSISSMTGHAISVAEDHLEMLTDYYTKTSRGIRPFAMYTLIRTAIESAANGLWLLSNEDQSERILAALRFVKKQHDSAMGLQALAGDVETEKDERTVARLEQIRDSIPSIKGRSLRLKATTTDIITSVDASGDSRLPGLWVWKAASGIAHGEHIATLSLLERRQVSEGDGLGASYRLTSKVSTLAAALETALDYLERLINEDRKRRTR